MPFYVRKNITYRASTAILCSAGSELGNTMHGHHDFQLSDDVLHKVHVGHYTFYSKAIVKNPKLMIRCPAVFSREYVSGEEDQFPEKSWPETEAKTDIIDKSEGGSGTGKLQTLIKGADDMFGSTKDNETEYYVRGTMYTKKQDGTGSVTSKTINTLGFGEHTYPGCRYAREGRGVALAGVERTTSSMI